MLLGRADRDIMVENMPIVIHFACTDEVDVVAVRGFVVSQYKLGVRLAQPGPRLLARAGEQAPRGPGAYLRGTT